MSMVSPEDFSYGQKMDTIIALSFSLSFQNLSLYCSTKFQVFPLILMLENQYSEKTKTYLSKWRQSCSSKLASGVTWDTCSDNHHNVQY